MTPSIASTNTNPVGRFFGWWRRELVSFWPGSAGYRSLGNGRPSRAFAFVHNTAGWQLFEERRGTRTPADNLTTQQYASSPDDLDRLAATIPRASIPLVIRVAPGDVLIRNVMVPESALADAARIATLDFERATPLRRDDVLLAHDIQPGPAVSGKRRVRQYVVKAETIAPVRAALARRGLVEDRIEALDEATGEPHAFAFIAAGLGGSQRKSPRWPYWLALAPVAGLAIAAGLVLNRAETAEARLATEVDAQRKQQAELRQSMARKDGLDQRADAIARLIASHPSRVEVLERVSRLLPRTDYLTSFTVEGSEIELSGLSASAASLIPLFERSGHFTGAQLTAPSVLDTRSSKERFTLRARIVTREPARAPDVRSP
ncbi:MAG: hypothetical protein RL291_1158 [Pseudomonadota bacterium]